jgi:hypothetical protein
MAHAFVDGPAAATAATAAAAFAEPPAGYEDPQLAVTRIRAIALSGLACPYRRYYATVEELQDVRIVGADFCINFHWAFTASPTAFTDGLRTLFVYTMRTMARRDALAGFAMGKMATLTRMDSSAWDTLIAFDRTLHTTVLLHAAIDVLTRGNASDTDKAIDTSKAPIGFTEADLFAKMVFDHSAGFWTPADVYKMALARM